MGDVIALLQDAIKFVRYFAPAIGHSAPHIYISALPFAPQRSILKWTYTPKFNKTIALQSGQLQHWPAQQAILPGHTDQVWSVAFSPDGKHITIRIWDAETGKNVGEPLEGHTDLVVSVAFSPDGKHIVSGSDDKTIRIWDAETGENVGEPQTGHVSLWSFFTDQATIHQNGWVYGMHGELLLWVPPLHRPCLYPLCLHWSSALKVIGPYEAHIELTCTLWGMEWTGVAKT
ncbi:hypothetical protein M422DRAFT_179127 [Sphaerobolus stellatus SS14]|uniref:WD40 repeat-like protein n=1 Tax=Sphaerobolus stellatus (strain SS14) TaxID=990650 RepID=A0A0C9VG67_SPHS4|nr:hypothetical protein M422DRAFT_179127 [Sphaerobolus stellatus SS14]